MRKACAIGVCLFTVMVGSSVALAKGPPPPAWCKVDGQLEQGFVDDIKKSDDADRAVRAIVYQMCNPQYVQDGESPIIADGYKRWSARLELTDADWAGIAQFTAGHDDLEIHPIDTKSKWSTLSPIDQYAYLQYSLVETPGLNGETDPSYVADAYGSRLSELGRLGFIDKCMASGHTVTPVEMAMCQPDIEAFDFHKIVAELRADKTHSPAVVAIIRLVADRDREKIKHRTEDVKKLIAKDDAYKKMFEISAQVRKDWDAHAKDYADVLAVQDDMDDAMISNSRKAAAGCHEKTFKALQAAISKLPAKAFAVKRIPDKEYEFADDVMNRAVEIIIADPVGSLAASAYTQCAMVDPEKGDNLAASFSTTLSRWSGFRGPRSATYTAILLANLQLDDRSERIEYPSLERIWFKQSNAQGGGSSGAVEALKTTGDKTNVKFGQKLVKETVDTGCSRSNHVVGIRGDGSIEYEYNCTGSKTVTYDGRPQPVDVNSRYVGGTKAGNMVMVNTDILWMTWPKPEASIPSYVLGAPVK